mgnify:CR=1 FL=1
MTQTFMLRFADQATGVLQAILDQSVDCIALVNRAGEIEWLNPNGRRAFDLDGQEHGSWIGLWPQDGQARPGQALDRAWRGQHDRFQAYGPASGGELRWWDVTLSPICAANGTQTHVLATSRDITDQMQEQLSDRLRREEAERLAERSDNVAREMRHRLKNQLAVVSSVGKLLARHSTGAADLMERFEGKLQALARAQDLLTANRDEPIVVSQAIAQVLEASGAGERIEVRPMPAARLGDDAIQHLALILGELQTNSLKYGALGKGRGGIVLTGALDASLLSLTWHEDTGEEITAPASHGSGFTLLTRLGSVSGRAAQLRWQARGPEIEFHVRVQ